MDTNMTGFRWFLKLFAFFCHGRKVVSLWKELALINMLKKYLMKQWVMPIFGYTTGNTEFEPDQD